MSHFKNYVGSEFLTAEFPKRDWLIENICRKNDSVILVGNEKSGKSLFVFQLLCSLTSCHPFLDIYNVPKALKVVYIQLEGEIADSQDRMKRMIKTIDIVPEERFTKVNVQVAPAPRGGNRTVWDLFDKTLTEEEADQLFKAWKIPFKKPVKKEKVAPAV